MKLNWKVRFKNKVWLASFLGLIVSFAFSVMKMLGVVPPVTENQVLGVVNQVLMVLGMLGIIIDPTTAGVQDSDRAMTYDEPWVDAPPDDEPHELKPEE